MSELEQLQQLIESKKDSDPSLSYTAKLFSQGIEEIQKKFGEESIELIIASNRWRGRYLDYSRGAIFFSRWAS